MLKKMLVICRLSISLLSLINVNTLNGYIIRSATEADLPELFEVDRTISFEYFIPLYSQGYSHIELGKNPAHFLELELAHDQEWFPDIIKNKSASELFLVGYDDEKNAIMGFIIVHKTSENDLEIDLLLILKEYRGMKLGKSLITQALNHFPEVTMCHVHPLRFANESTLKFYESIGFINMGIPTTDALCIYGIPFSEMYLDYQLNLTPKRRLPDSMTSTHYSIRGGTGH